MDALTIGGVARKAGVGVETVRFYERKGLVEQPRKPSDSGFRLYSADAVRRIRFIRQAQQVGFSLQEIQELLSLRADPSADCGAVQRKAAAKVDAIDRKIGELEKVRAALQEVIAACPGRGGLRVCTILEALDAVERPTPKRAGSAARRRQTR